MVVVGAGPAGSTAARNLAAAGVHVVVLEKEKLPRYKTCGGGVVLRAVQLAGLDSLPCIERTLHTAELHLHGTELHYVVRRAAPLLVTTMRAELDSWLCRMAQRAGAEIRDACAVRALALEDGAVKVRTESGTLRARYVIAADGAASRVARWAGWRANPSCIPALEWELPVSSAVLERHAGVARFDLGATHRGYAWVFPKREHLSVGILQARRGARDLRSHLDRYMKRVGLQSASGADQHGALIPLAPRPGGAARGRVMLVGDAAGFVDPVTCEGITYAVRSGQLAARALIEAREDDVATTYDASSRQEIVAELRMARHLSRVVFGPTRIRDWLFERVGQSFGELMADIIMGHRTYHQLLESPTNYARLFARLLHPARNGSASVRPPL